LSKPIEDVEYTLFLSVDQRKLLANVVAGKAKWTFHELLEAAATDEERDLINRWRELHHLLWISWRSRGARLN
jgi:hypothetical protein